MYAKSFLALDGNGRLTGARTAQAAPYAHYTCHLCGSALRYHPQYDTERPWFEHTDDGLTAHGHTVSSVLMSDRNAGRYA